MEHVSTDLKNVIDLYLYYGNTDLKPEGFRVNPVTDLVNELESKVQICDEDGSIFWVSPHTTFLDRILDNVELVETKKASFKNYECDRIRNFTTGKLLPKNIVTPFRYLFSLSPIDFGGEIHEQICTLHDYT